MDFTNIKSIQIPEGNVKQISANGVTLWQAGRLPSEYQEVEYIYQTDNVSYLDLGFSFDTACIIYMGYKRYSSAQSQIFGATDGSGSYRCMITDNTTQLLMFGTNGSSYASAGIPSNTNYRDLKAISEERNLRLEDLITGDYGVYTYNIHFTLSNNFYLLGQNYRGTPRGGSGGYVYYFKYYDKNSTLICDLVPCYRKSDGEIGMYDLVRKIFLTNAGTGNLLKGADV